MAKIRAPSQKQIEYGKRQSQESRKMRFLDGKWLCSACGLHKTVDEYYNVKTKSGNPTSRCAECCRKATLVSYKKRAKIGLQDRQEKKAKRAEERRQKLLSQMLTCARCGETKPRGEWPIQRGTPIGDFPGKTRKYCCSPSKRTDAEVEEDIRLGSKVCSSCGERKPFESFSPNRNSKDGRQTTCKKCRRAKVGSGEWVGGRTGRKEIIAARSDGTLTAKVVSEMFGKAKVCPCCTGTMSRDDKVMDHIIPLKLGGEHSAQNTMVLCRWCNSAKSARHPSDWLDMLNDEAAARMRVIYAERGFDFG